LAAEAKGLHDIAGEITGKNGSNAARQFYRWRVRSAALSRIYARAMASRAHVIAQRAWQEIEDEPDAQKARVKLDAIKWLAAKFNRAEFGDEPTGASVNVTINDEAGAAVLDELRQRLARKRKSMLTVGGEGVRDEKE